MLLQQAEKLAELRNTEVIAHRYSEDGSELTFVLASGPKYKMTEEQLREAIREAQPSEPFDYIEQGAPTAPTAAPAAPPADNGGSPRTPRKGKRKTK